MSSGYQVMEFPWPDVCVCVFANKGLSVFALILDQSVFLLPVSEGCSFYRKSGIAANKNH